MTSEIIPQLCGLMIVILLIIFYSIHKNLKLYKERIFHICLISTFVSLVIDIFSIFCIYYPNIFNELLTKIICKSYLATLIFLSWSTTIYVYAYIFEKKTHKGFMLYAVLLVFVLIIVVFIAPINLVTTNNSVYTNGPSVLSTYIICAAFVVTTIVSTAIFRKKINNRRAFAIFLWMAIWFAGALIQFFNNEAPLVGFAASLGLLILSTAVENPEGNTDREYSCFNSYALTSYVESLVEDKIEFDAIEVSLEDLGIDRREENVKTIKQKTLQASKIIGKIKELYIFKNLSNGFVIIIRQKDSIEDVAILLKRMFQDQGLLDKSIWITCVKNASTFHNANHMQSFFDFLKKKHEYGSSRVYTSTEDELISFYSKYSISKQIDAAIQEDRVDVYFQPIYSCKDKMFTCAEALVRIKNLNGTLLPPGEFIPVAEETGQITELSKVIYEKVCLFISESNVLELGLKTIDFNLSVSECRNANLAKEIIEMTEKYNVNPKNIVLEVTETSSLQEKEVFISSMNKLIKKGFTFALDDFGKGESNLNYIIDMPVSILKIDYDLTKSFFKSEKAQTAIRSIINMAHDLKMKIVSEGIETKDENDTFIKEKADFIQGFYNSTALNMNDFISFLEEKNNKI